MEAVWPSSEMNRRRFVRGDERFCATGMMSASSGRKAAMAWLIDPPRPANASPNPLRFVRMAARVLSSNMFTNSSNSTGAGVAALSGIVSPSVKPSSERPGESSTYLRPSADLLRISRVESRGSGATSRSILSDSTATLEPSSRRRAAISLTVPTREPPMRTSLPGTSAAALGTSALSEYVGTNGRPWFALYARKTATSSTSTVAAPMRTGLLAIPAPERFLIRIPSRRGSRAAARRTGAESASAPG
jgi:hypothetical protein